MKRGFLVKKLVTSKIKSMLIINFNDDTIILAFSFVEKPDNIWHYGLLILSVVVCVAMHLIVSTISESERNPIQEDYIITTITEREIPQ